VLDVLQTVFLEPEDIEIQLVALDQLLVAEAAEALGLLAFLVTTDEVVQVATDQRLGPKRLVDISAVVVDPQFSRLRLARGRALFEEQHVRLHARAVPDAGWQAQQRMKIELLQQAPASALAGPA